MKPLRFVFVIAMLQLAAAPAFCDQASREAKAEEYVRLAKMDQTLIRAKEMIANQMKSGAMQQIMGAKLTPEAQKNNDAMLGKIMALLGDTLSWEKLKPTYVKIFAEAFTEEELDGIVAFYKSPAGQALVDKTPAMMTKGNDVVQEKIREVAPQLQKIILDFVAQAAQQPKQ